VKLGGTCPLGEPGGASTSNWYNPTAPDTIPANAGWALALPQENVQRQRQRGILLDL
jgi:hypothetical protein